MQNLLIALFSLALAISATGGQPGEYVVVDDTLAAYQKSDLDDALRMLRYERDANAVRQMVLEGRVIGLAKGTTVYLVDANLNIFGNMESIKIRVRGNPEPVWIPREDVVSTEERDVKDDSSDLSAYAGNTEALQDLARKDAEIYQQQHDSIVDPLKIGWHRAQMHHLRGNDAKIYANAFGAFINPNGPSYK